MYFGSGDNIILYLLGVLLVALLILGGIVYVVWRFFLKDNVAIHPFVSQKKATAQLLFLFFPALLLVSIISVFDGEGTLSLTLALISAVTIGTAIWLRFGYGVVWGVLWLIPTWVQFANEQAERLPASDTFDPQDSLELATIIGTVVLFTLMYVVGRQVSKYEARMKRMADTFMNIGILGIGVSALGVSGLPVVEAVSEVYFEMSPYTWSIVIGVGVLVGISIAFQLVRSQTMRITEGIGLGVFIVWWVLMGVLGQPPDAEEVVDPEVLNIIFNVLALGVILGAILLGGQRQEKRLINLGAIFLILWVLITYISWSSTLFNSGVIFIVGGLLLLAVGYGVERFRRSMIESTNEGA